jgi:hypothetical protein
MAQHVATLRPGPTVRSKLQRLARAAAYLKAIHTRAGAGLSNSDGGGGFYWFWHTLALFQSVTLARVCRSVEKFAPESRVPTKSSDAIEIPLDRRIARVIERIRFAGRVPLD